MNDLVIREEKMFKLKPAIKVGYIGPCTILGVVMLSTAWLAYSSVSFLISL